MPVSLETRWLKITVICMMIINGCASYKPRQIEEVPFRGRAKTQVEGNVRVTAAVPGSEESKRLFGVNTYARGVQPIWLEIENNDEKPVFFLPVGLDPNYFSTFEAAFVNHFSFITPLNEKMNRHFLRWRQRLRIDPGSLRTGFVYTSVDEGTKDFTVDVVGDDNKMRTFTFFINVPGLRIDHHKVNFKAIYSEKEVVFLDRAGLREALESFSCCTTNKKGTGQGDPLNLVVVGVYDEVMHAFIRSGWDETETIYRGSVLKTIKSFLFGGRYRYSPVSGLYVYGRPQDIALQKARETIHERNHLRLWLSPMRIAGKPVWVGQISRDIGVRFTIKTITTHKIDPDVDETREFIIQDLIYAQGLTKVAYVKGVGSAPINEPRGNLTGDPYFTDGLRAVLWVSSNPTDFEEVEFIEWELPPER